MEPLAKAVQGDGREGKMNGSGRPSSAAARGGLLRSSRAGGGAGEDDLKASNTIATFKVQLSQAEYDQVMKGRAASRREAEEGA